MTERESRQIELDARVGELRAQAAAKQAQADAINGRVNDDYAFWTQPAYGNAAGRAFARQRDRERAKMAMAMGISAEAKALHQKANDMEARGVVMAGDALVKHTARVQACDVAVGQLVDTTHYGVRKVLKVNKISVLVESSFGSLKVGKEYVRAVAA